MTPISPHLEQQDWFNLVMSSNTVFAIPFLLRAIITKQANATGIKWY